MSKRAKYETDQGLVTLSRGVLTVYNKETGNTSAYRTGGPPTKRTRPGDILTVPLFGGQKMSFRVVKTPGMLRDESLKRYAPQELARLQKLGDDDAVAAFKKRYSKYLGRT